MREKKIGELIAAKNRNHNAKVSHESFSVSCSMMVAANRDEIRTRSTVTILELSMADFSSHWSFTAITGRFETGFHSLYTVQVSLREHNLIPEPFLLVGLIAAIRRVLVLTAEFAEVKDESGPVFNHLIIELAVLTFLAVAIVISSFSCENAASLPRWSEPPDCARNS